MATTPSKTASTRTSAGVPRVGKLDTILQVRRELARIYRLARAESMDVQLFRACVFALQTLSTLIKDDALEQRIAHVEDQLSRRTDIPSSVVMGNGAPWAPGNRTNDRTNTARIS